MCIISGIIALSTTLATSLGSALAATAGVATATATGAAAALPASIAVPTALGVTVPVATGTAGISTATATTIGFGAMAVAELAVAGAVAGGVIGVVSSTQQAQAAANQAEYMQKLEEWNAKQGEIAAQNLEIQGDQERRKLRVAMLDKLSAGRVGYGAAGVVLGRGSPVDYEVDVMDAYDLDKRNLDYDIAGRSWQTRMGAVNSSAQAQLYGAQSSNYRKQATSSLIGGSIKTFSDTAGFGLGTLSTIAPLMRKA